MKKITRNIFEKLVSSIQAKIEESTRQNIKLELSKRSLSTTVDYIQENMEKVSSVDTKWMVHDLAFKQAMLQGVILEFGVYRGETINHIAAKTSAPVFGFDSFEGLPEFWRDGFSRGEFAMNNLPSVRENVNLIKGWFDETLPAFVDEYKFDAVSYLHIDCDLYSSTKTILNNLKSKIKSGTVIVFDEYFNYPGWENHEYKAFKEFITDTGYDFDYITYNNKHEQVALIIL
jgi:hypothetical protein